MIDTPVFEDTRTLNAMVHLDYMGSECTRDELLDEIRQGFVVVMAYVGGGYVPLTVAIGTVDSNYHNPNVSDAYSALWEYLADERPDELNEQGDIEELTFQVVPQSVVAKWTPITEVTAKIGPDSRYTVYRFTRTDQNGNDVTRHYSANDITQSSWLRLASVFRNPDRVFCGTTSIELTVRR
jgi:hypothetical protein